MMAVEAGPPVSYRYGANPAQFANCDCPTIALGIVLSGNGTCGILGQ
jgi:hypothetical protein